MATHPGEVDYRCHNRGERIEATWPVHVKRFPLTEQEARAVERAGGTVYDVSYGQEVVKPGGVATIHGVDDGLHGEE